MTERLNEGPALNREGWLTRLAELVAPWFTEAGLELMPFRVSCGWPSDGALEKGGARTLGECWPECCSADGVREIFITPAMDDATEVAQVLVHEMLHAALPSGVGHGAPFRKGMKPLLLEGKPTATVAGPAFVERITPILDELGEYPHSIVDRTVYEENRKKQGTRMIKVICPGCGYTLRTTAKWLEIGLPTCCCGEEMEAEIPE